MHKRGVAKNRSKEEEGGEAGACVCGRGGGCTGVRRHMQHWTQKLAALKAEIE